MIRRFIVFMLALAFLPLHHVSASEWIKCDCRASTCVCFIQKGDEGPFVSAVIKLLKEKGYCDRKQKVSIFDEGARNGVIALQKEAGIPETGMLDDETLTFLIFDMLPFELDKADPLSRGECNWIPTDGGKRRHYSPECSRMYDPRKVSVRNAEALGYTICGLNSCSRKEKEALAQLQ